MLEADHDCRCRYSSRCCYCFRCRSGWRSRSLKDALLGTHRLHKSSEDRSVGDWVRLGAVFSQIMLVWYGRGTAEQEYSMISKVRSRKSPNLDMTAFHCYFSYANIADCLTVTMPESHACDWTRVNMLMPMIVSGVVMRPNAEEKEDRMHSLLLCQLQRTPLDSACSQCNRSVPSQYGPAYRMHITS